MADTLPPLLTSPYSRFLDGTAVFLAKLAFNGVYHGLHLALTSRVSDLFAIRPVVIFRNVP
ncbi:hypothetical protein RvY_08627 [Ramazzottius varieornatus]|uniref:Uncharacterized protein n=1 Tax=Ramazzottius varieornatus TaxID=947166 RepID=A0A1D1VC39_RAMVA|nr:hypothetical protein RvY_08627 [Ramazzottius varieornatus]